MRSHARAVTVFGAESELLIERGKDEDRTGGSKTRQDETLDICDERKERPAVS